MQRFYDNHEDHLHVEYFPSYSPELNPIERVWKLTRRCCTHNQYFESLEDLIKTVETQLKLWEKPNEVLKKLCGII